MVKKKNNFFHFYYLHSVPVQPDQTKPNNNDNNIGNNDNNKGGVGMLWESTYLGVGGDIAAVILRMLHIDPSSAFCALS